MGNKANGKNEINCIYNQNEDTINLLFDFNENLPSYYSNDIKAKYNETNKYMKDIFKYIDIFINDKKIKFNTKYRPNEKGEINVKFIFHKSLTNSSFMFYGCSSLESIDLSSFNTTNVMNMSALFDKCSSLESLDLSSFNTTNVTDISDMFNDCCSLRKKDFLEL